MDMTDRTRERGFTLIEVMAALLIFGIGLLGIMALHIVARKGNNDAQDVTAATVVAEHWMERLRTESTMWNYGSADLTVTRTPMLSPLGAGADTTGATTGWIPPPQNPLLTRTSEESVRTETDGTEIPMGEYCTEYRVTTLIPNQVLRAEVRVMWWKEDVARPVNWNTCPPPPGSGGNPDITLQHVVTLSSTLWRNPL
jgi:prepilin-type N-terminal cleavage/methylation domain-containing protein